MRLCILDLLSMVIRTVVLQTDGVCVCYFCPDFLNAIEAPQTVQNNFPQFCPSLSLVLISPFMRLETALISLMIMLKAFMLQ